MSINQHSLVFVFMPTPSSSNCVGVFVFVRASMCVFLPQQAPRCSPPARSINAQPCPRLICHSRCIFAFILICTSPLNWLSICPSRCSNLIVFVHYRWASTKADTLRHTCTYKFPSPLQKSPFSASSPHLQHIPRQPILTLYLTSSCAIKLSNVTYLSLQGGSYGI